MKVKCGSEFAWSKCVKWHLINEIRHSDTIPAEEGKLEEPLFSVFTFAPHTSHVQNWFSNGHEKVHENRKWFFYSKEPLFSQCIISVKPRGLLLCYTDTLFSCSEWVCMCWEGKKCCRAVAVGSPLSCLSCWAFFFPVAFSGTSKAMQREKNFYAHDRVTALFCTWNRIVFLKTSAWQMLRSPHNVSAGSEIRRIWRPWQLLSHIPQNHFCPVWEA